MGMWGLLDAYETDAAHEVLNNIVGLGIGDKGLIRPSLKASWDYHSSIYQYLMR